ncbi:kinase-like domain-containing protein [Syncephalis fuscata]|nr:kinase-like domain-containing protein [Syncephalis fuscata]
MRSIIVIATIIGICLSFTKANEAPETSKTSSKTKHSTTVVGASRDYTVIDTIPFSSFPYDLVNNLDIVKDGTLVINQWHQKRRWVIPATVTYRGKKAFLKCSSDYTKFTNEMEAFNDMHLALAKPKNPIFNARKWVVQRQGSFKINEYVCIILSHGGDMDMHSYSSTLTPAERDKVMFKLFYQLIHGVAFINFAGRAHNDLKPNNIMIDTTNPAEPRLSIIDFDLSSRLYVLGKAIQPQKAPDYSLRKGDSWSAIATMYSFYNGTPVYGRVTLPDGTSRHQNWHSYYDEMKVLFNRSVNTKRTPNLGHNVPSLFKNENGNILRLFSIDPKYRPTPEAFTETWGYLNWRL